MKQLSDYSNEELLALTDTEIQDLIDYECALQGVPLLPPGPGPAPAKPEVPHDEVFKVAGFYFYAKESAMRVLDVLMELDLYQVEGYNETRRLVPIAKDDNDYYYAPKIETDLVVSAVNYALNQEVLASYKRAYDTWNTHKKVYDAAYKDCKCVSEQVYERISEARQIAGYNTSMLVVFAKYLKLADGDAAVATKFLRAAYPAVDTTTLDYINPGWDNPVIDQERGTK